MADEFMRRPDEDAVEHFERIADLFRRETGYLRPGKDCVIHSREERMAAWKKWVSNKVAEAQATGG